MTEFVSLTGATVAASVLPQEYQRLLGLPRERSLEGDLRERAESARNWYAQHGIPFLASRRVALNGFSGTSVFLSTGQEFRSTVLANRLSHGEAHAVMVLAASAGNEVATEISRLWKEERPDEAFFLDRFAVAVTESLLLGASVTLCRTAESSRETLLPHLSPGCGHWDLADQHKVMEILTGKENTEKATLGPLTLLPSGALHPQHSILAVLGVTYRNYATTPKDLCRSCDLTPCAFRRAPFSEAAPALEVR